MKWPVHVISMASQLAMSSLPSDRLYGVDNYKSRFLHEQGYVDKGSLYETGENV